MVPGAREARCNDAERLMAVAGRPFRSQIKAVRPGCGCFDARDIGGIRYLSSWMPFIVTQFAAEKLP